MKLCRFNAGRIGIVRDDQVTEVMIGDHSDEAMLALLQGGQMPLASSAVGPLSGVALESPIQRPGKIVAAPVNYRAHIEEMAKNGQAFGHVITDLKKAGMFLKAPSSIVGPSQGIALRFPERRTDHEIELCAVIGTRASKVREQDALACVAGYCLGLDITLRGPEDRSFRKSIDTYTVLGPYVVSADEVSDPQAIDLSIRVNGELRQHTNTSDMVYGVAALISFTSQFYTLQPGDVLMTGTPQGVGPIVDGDLIVAEAPGLGSMSVRVRTAA